METNLQTLNDRYAIPGHVTFEAGPGGLPTAVIENQLCSASMPTLGANILTFAPKGQKPVLWTAPHEVFQDGKALHSGIPVCWPWFAANTENPKLPLHGIVRTKLWSVTSTNPLPDGSTQVVMSISDSPETLAVWPHPFELEITAVFGASLQVSWLARNTGNQEFQYTGAFHPYFNISDIRNISVTGLDGIDYLDKTLNFERKTQTGPIQFTGWTDRIYLNTRSDVVIEDAGFNRKINITKSGSQTTVVWNPDHVDEEIPAIGKGGHQTFVCVEAANAVDDRITVPPGKTGMLSMEIKCA